MDRKYIENTVREKLELYLNVDMSDKDAADPIVNDNTTLDSIVIVEILVDLESEFDFDFDDEELSDKTLYSIETLTDAIINHLSQRGDN